VLTTLDTKMIPSMQVDVSVSSQETTAEGTAGKFKESDTFMVGGRQWKLCCYPTCMNDHKWIWMFQTALTLSSFLYTNPKWYMSRCCYEYTHSHMAIRSHYVIVCQACDCFHIGVSIVACNGWRPKR
jgi:hypothetical protein